MGHPIFCYFLDGLETKFKKRNGNIISEKFHFFHYFYMLHSRGICHEETCSLFFLLSWTLPYNFPKCHVLIRVCALCKIVISEMVIVLFQFSRCWFYALRSLYFFFFVINLFHNAEINTLNGKYKVYLANLFPV